jgi:L-threonylcarbamoyladenylate synthase
MKTKTLKWSDSDSDLHLVQLSFENLLPIVIPTETVYGLAAPYNELPIVRNIFKIKNRPADNPLIVHIASLDYLSELIDNNVSDLPENVVRLMNDLWPGPLTILFRKSANVADLITAGSDFVGVRIPANPIAKMILEKTKIPLVAPSANISGRPSPTNAFDAYEDLDGKVECIFDGGQCEFGLESTVIKMNDSMDSCEILRPGKVTVEDLANYFKVVRLNESITKNVLENSEKVISPGLKYKHYSPKAKVIIVDDISNFKEDPLSELDFVLTYSKSLKSKNSIYFESEDALARKLFSTFRDLDRRGATVIFVEDPVSNLALKNRLIKASI